MNIGPQEGLEHDSGIQCDALVSLPKLLLTDYPGSLSAGRLADLKTALRITLAIE